MGYARPPRSTSGERRVNDVFCACTRGLEPALLFEARKLSAQARLGTLGVSLPAGLHRKACLWLRTASRVGDASGADLWKRGYRQELSMAPLRESIAAGLLLLAGYDGSEPLWDPMCGSGTLLIE